MQPILLFIDETYLANGTGKIQTVIPVSVSLYQSVVVPECRKFLRHLGSNAKEFKGGNIKRGNLKAYKSFLRLFTNLSAVVAAQSPLRSVITLDGNSLESGEPFASVHKHILLALNHVGISDSQQVAAAFSRQLVWLKEHFAAISSHTFPNPLVLTFDNQFSYDRQMQDHRAVMRNGGELDSFRKLEDILTIAANCLLQQWQLPVKLPPIQQMSFRDSATEFGLQAADLFCNLYFNFVLAELGHSDASTTFKAEVCHAFLPSLTVSNELRASANLVSLPDGRISFEMSDPYFGEQAILGPPLQGLGTLKTP